MLIKPLTKNVLKASSNKSINNYYYGIKIRIIPLLFSLFVQINLKYLIDFHHWIWNGMEMFYLTTHSTHFIYGYMESDIWLRTTQIVREETHCCHMGYSFRLTARFFLYAPSHRQDSTYHSLCYTSCGALAGMRNSSVGPLNVFYLWFRSTWRTRSPVARSRGLRGSTPHSLSTWQLSPEWERERNVLFNDALNTFYLRLYGVRHMVMDHSDSEKGNQLPPHRLLFPINSKGSFIWTIQQTG